MRFPLGAPIRQSTTVRQLNVDGTTTLVNATTLTLTVQKPDATQQVYSTPTNDGTGLYHQDIPASDLTQIGHYQLIWTATGTGAGVQPSDFDVYDPFEPAVLPLQDAKDHLNIPQSSTASDAELQSWIATIETNMEALTGGPLASRTITAERAELTSDLMILQVRQRPVVSVTSITSVPSGAVADISPGLDIDPLTDTIRMKGGQSFPVFSPLVNVTYVAGWGAAVPAAFGNAARIILAHLWDLQHGPSVRPSMGGGGELVLVPGFSFAIPERAAALLKGNAGGLPFTSEVFA